MSQPPDATSVWTWIAGIAGITVVGAALYAIGAKVFGYVSRTEMVEQIAAQDAKFLSAIEQIRTERRQISQEQREEMLRLHNENRVTNTEVFQRIADLDKGVARIEGALSGRFQKLSGDGR